jgi:hypothetical protein
MSEIPLRSFGRSRKARAGYTTLPGNDYSGADPTNKMPSAARNAAAAGRSTGKPRRADRYEDDPEEEETLLGDQSCDRDDADEVGPEVSSRVSPCFFKRYLKDCSLLACFWYESEDKVHTEQDDMLFMCRWR